MSEAITSGSQGNENIDIETDKDTWIYTFGSQELQRCRTLGYECQKQYLKERLKLEYPGFTVADRVVKRVDYPTQYAIRQSSKYENAYVGERYYPTGEVMTVDNYLGEHQIIKLVRKPWYLAVSSNIWIPGLVGLVLGFYAVFLFG